MQVSVSETPRRLSFRHFSFFIFILSRIFHTDVADETQKWKKKKREKRKDDEIRLIYDNVYDSVPGHWKWPKKKKKERGREASLCFWLLTICVRF